MNEPEDHILLQSFKEGNEKAFETIFNRFKGKVFNYAQKIVISTDNSKEIVQQVFIKLWERRKNIDTELTLDPYLYVITRNSCLDLLRKSAKDKILKEELLEANEFRSNQTEDNIIFKEYEKIALKAIDQLPAKRKQIYKLSRIDGMTYDEISKHLGISKNTVKTHLLKAYKFIKNYINLFTDVTFIIFLNFFENFY